MSTLYIYRKYLFENFSAGLIFESILNTKVKNDIKIKYHYGRNVNFDISFRLKKKLKKLQ
jgi:hypothetical protein